ncbi:MAG: PhoH family protein [Flavobacteriaceae bacterium]|nr:PhoH family protein [Flavobacteriaceae bacterium]
MSENFATISLGDINPLDFYGQQNCYIDRIGSYFPHLKLVARGMTLKVFGSHDEIERFKISVDLMFDYILQYNKFDFEAIEQILGGKFDNTINNKKDAIVHGVGGKLIRPKTHNQRKLVDAVSKCDIVFVIGPAGTGKTYVSLALAVDALKNHKVRRIILTRPAVEAGEHLGFLPGDLQEKLDPYMQPLYDGLQAMIPNAKLNQYIERKVIQIAPIAFMRGRTLEDAFVILDEAQNTTHKQMKMFLTRMGTGSKFIVTGDLGQIDLFQNSNSGLLQAINLFENMEGIEVVRLNESDVIRHYLVKKIIRAYQDMDDKRAKVSNKK